MKGELERIVEKIRDKYKFEEVKEPLLSEIKLTYMIWRLKGMIWHEIGKESADEDICDLPLYIDRLFDEISTISDTWLNVLTSFNSKCLNLINNKKIIEMLIDLLILRNVYYELRKSS